MIGLQHSEKTMTMELNLKLLQKSGEHYLNWVSIKVGEEISSLLMFSSIVFLTEAKYLWFLNSSLVCMCARFIILGNTALITIQHLKVAHDLKIDLCVSLGYEI